jgi:hypothetical protein
VGQVVDLSSADSLRQCASIGDMTTATGARADNLIRVKADLGGLPEVSVVIGFLATITEALSRFRFLDPKE